MIRTDATWLRMLADLVESGEVQVGRVEIRNGGVMFGTFHPGTFAMKEIEQDIREADARRKRRPVRIR